MDMKDNNVLPDGQCVQSEELKQVKEELRRVKQQNRFMAIRLRRHDRRKAELATKMCRIAATTQQVGKVRIVDVNAVDAEQRSQQRKRRQNRRKVSERRQTHRS